MTDDRASMLQGTLDFLILESLAEGEMHGWGISDRIRRRSRDVLQVNQGSLYPALHRLEHRGLVRSEWGTSENNRRARFYRLTGDGRGQLAEERAGWERFVEAVERVVGGTGGEGETGRGEGDVEEAWT